ncbi:hypothetical protein AKG37_14945 [Bacillus australimaris]|uniref:Uncharacterized protein n=1 Tax=Bacillus australimaris TaxID=1326968 RepID=A0ABR5MP97_9BACI|nr:hypothetical protein AKG37_14945 [Bacillus australimaris]
MFSYKHSFSPIHGRGGTKENEPLEYTTKYVNRKVITGQGRQQPVQAIKGEKTKISGHRKTFYENRPNIDRKFCNFPVVISIKRVKRHKSKESV